jgi:hypothetical protein
MEFSDTGEFQLISREVSDVGQMIETMEMNGVKATRTFMRI